MHRSPLSHLALVAFRRAWTAAVCTLWILALLSAGCASRTQGSSFGDRLRAFAAGLPGSQPQATQPQAPPAAPPPGLDVRNTRATYCQVGAYGQVSCTTY